MARGPRPAPQPSISRIMPLVKRSMPWSSKFMPLIYRKSLFEDSLGDNFRASGRHSRPCRRPFRSLLGFPGHKTKNGFRRQPKTFQNSASLASGHLSWVPPSHLPWSTCPDFQEQHCNEIAFEAYAVWRSGNNGLIYRRWKLAHNPPQALNPIFSRFNNNRYLIKCMFGKNFKVRVTMRVGYQAIRLLGCQPWSTNHW